MSALPVASLDQAALARLGILQGLHPSEESVLGLDWPEFEKGLPDRGLPRGVVEIASVRGGTTTVAIRAVRAVHEADPQAWCAWISPKSEETPSLYAPALVKDGVDLDRLLVVRPEPQALARTAVKVAASGAFELVVIDVPARSALGRSKVPDAVVVRKLALAAEESGTTSLLLTNAHAPRPVPWPVAMRLEVERRPDAIAFRITKDRRGERMSRSSQHVVRLVESCASAP
jgi:recombination protein RecA